MLGIFRNNTFFKTVASYSNYFSPDDVLCQQLRAPFTGVYDDTGANGDTSDNLWSQGSPYVSSDSDFESPSNGALLNALLDWLPNFGNSLKATATLMLIYAHKPYSNNAILDLASPRASWPIMYDPGKDM